MISSLLLTLSLCGAHAFSEVRLESNDAAAIGRTDTVGETRIFRVTQTAKLSGISEDAKLVRWWIAIPDNERHQDLLDFDLVDAPGTWSIVRDADRGNRFLYVEVANPGKTEIEAQVRFTLQREPVLQVVDPAKVGALRDVHRQLFADALDRNAPNMEVTDELQAIADEVCGDETNPALMAKALLAYVLEYADHYSKDPTKPHCGIGSADDCLTNAGGCCTDLHSLFITLARARELPTRLQMGYRLNPKREGETYDPGYRCWVEYFLPGYGWVSADIVEADAPDGLGAERWFSGLTEWRLWLNEGREFRLQPNEPSKSVNTMIIGHALIDGKVARVLPDGPFAAQLSRTIRFDQVR